MKQSTKKGWSGLGVAAALLLPGIGEAQVQQYRNYDIQIVLDASGSMAERLGETTKIEVARGAIKNILGRIPGESRIGLRAYGHQSPREAKNCRDSAQLLPIRSVDAVAFGQTIDSIKPNGYTPIEFALKETQRDFDSNPESKKMVILVSDGQETCGGDPCAAAKALKQNGFDVEVNVVGFAVDTATADQLRCIADATGGEYRGADDAAELLEGLERFTQRARLDYQGSGLKLTPGRGFSDAPQLEPGDYSLDILDQETHFFKLPVSVGQQVSAIVNAKNNPPAPLSYCAHTVEAKLYDARRSSIANDRARINSGVATPVSVALEDVPAKRGSFVYLSISSLREGTSKGCEKQQLVYELGLFRDGEAAPPPAAIVEESSLPEE